MLDSEWLKSLATAYLDDKTLSINTNRRIDKTRLVNEYAQNLFSILSSSCQTLNQWTDKEGMYHLLGKSHLFCSFVLMLGSDQINLQIINEMIKVELTIMFEFRPQKKMLAEFKLVLTPLGEVLAWLGKEHFNAAQLAKWLLEEITKAYLVHNRQTKRENKSEDLF